MAKKTNPTALCRGCKTRYDTSAMPPGSPFSCRHCGHVIYAPGERAPEDTGDASLPFGEIAVKHGFVTRIDLEKSLSEQESEKPETRIGEIMVDSGVINLRKFTAYQVEFCTE